MTKRKTLNVAVVHAEVLPVPPVLGGAIGQTIYETVQQMPDVNWTVISRWDDALQEVEADARFFYVDVDTHLTAVRQLFKEQGRRILSEAELKCFCYVEGVVEILKDCDVDVVQVHNRPQFLPYLKKHLPNKKFVLYLHNEADYYDARVRQGIALCDKLVFVSAYLARQFEAAFPSCKCKSVVIHNSVDVSFYHPKYRSHKYTRKLRKAHGLKKDAAVVFVGRTVQNKGLHCLIDAMEVVCRQHSRARLVVVGSPLFEFHAARLYVQRIKDQASKLKGRVDFVGHVDRKQLRYYYAAADVVVVPSLWAEPFGKVIVESMAMAVPVVASCRGGIPEIIQDGNGGMLVDDPEDPKMLARHILSLLKQRDSRLDIGKLGRKVAEAYFAPEGRYKKLRSVYQEVVS